MTPSVFDILENERQQYRVAVRDLARPAKINSDIALAIPSFVPKSVHSGQSGVAGVIAAALWLNAAIHVLSWVLARPDAVLQNGVGQVLRDVSPPTRPEKMAPADWQLFCQYASAYAEKLASRLEPDRLDQLGGRKPWYKVDVRAKLYRRLEIERAARALLVGQIAEDARLCHLWEQDCARYSVFYTLGASVSLSSRAAFLKELGRLTACPIIPADVADRETYRLAWLGAVDDVFEEVVGMKKNRNAPAGIIASHDDNPPAAEKTADRPSKSKRTLPRKQRALQSAKQDDAGQGQENEICKAPAAQPSEASGNVVPLDFDGEQDWPDQAAILNDAREKDDLRRLKRIYEDFWSAAAFAEPNQSRSPREAIKAVLAILDHFLTLWEALERYRAQRCVSRPSLVQTRQVIAGQVRLCLGRLEDLAGLHRAVGENRDMTRSQSGQNYEFAAKIETESAHLQTRMEEILQAESMRRPPKPAHRSGNKKATRREGRRSGRA